MSIEASRLLEARGSAYRAALTLLPGHRDESAATLQVSTTVLRIGSKACEVSALIIQDAQDVCSRSRDELDEDLDLVLRS